MTYTVKEIFYTLQGEGANAGQPAVLLRFAGCNLWTGREADRATATCRFCDTDFEGIGGQGGGRYSDPAELATAVASLWPEESAHRFVVCTGGEPLLQLDESLIERLHSLDFTVAIETNGTIAAPEGIDWICVSPKCGANLVQISGDELKVVYPQKGVDPADYVHLEFDQFFLQPMDGPAREANTRMAVEYCLANPRWRLSLQVHKVVGIQ